MPQNEISIEARLGTSKLAGDAKNAANIIASVLGSGQASGGARPMSAASMPGLPGSAQSYADQMAKQESKAKVAKYSSEPVAGALGGGGVNTGGTKTFQINRAVINVSAAKINVVSTKSGLGSPTDTGGAITSSGGSVGGASVSGSGHVSSSMFYVRSGENKAESFGRSFMQGSQIGAATIGNPLWNITDVYSMATHGVGGAYNAYKAIQANRSAKAEHSAASKPADHHSEHISNTISQSREMGSRDVSHASNIGSAVPVVGAVVGAIVGGLANLQQRLADAHVSYQVSQLATMGMVGNQSPGGSGALGKLGYSAAAKGQLIQQAQQHMTSTDFVRSGGMQGKESAFAFSGKFGHAMGIGAGAGMIMSAQLGEINKASHGKFKMSGENQLRNIAGYARGYEGGNSRRLGGIAQFVTGLAEQQQTEGGGGDATAIAAALSRLKGHGTLGEAQHAITGLSGMMSAGAHGGSPLSGMLMLGAAQRGESLKSVLKSPDKGITGQGIKDLKGMIPKEMMEMVMFGSGAKMTQAEHMTEAIYGKSNFKTLPEGTMGGTYNQSSQGKSNYWAFEQEMLGATGAAAAAAKQLRMVRDAGKSVAEFFMKMSGY